jgi:hypothetical protein
MSRVCRADRRILGNYPRAELGRVVTATGKRHLSMASALFAKKCWPALCSLVHWACAALE